MRKITPFLAMILSWMWCESLSQGIIPGSYTKPTPETFLIKNVETINFEFNIFKNNRYVLMISNNDGPDILWYIMLSRGKYYQQGNKLRFKDECFRANMKALVNHKSFTFSSAPDFLMKREFVLHYPANEKWEEPSYYSPYLITKADLHKHNRTYKTDFELRYGVYREYHMGMFDFRLKIMENNEYVLTCNEFVFSKGRWKRKHNVLMLKDILGFNICLLIKKGRLCYKYEPDKLLIFRYMNKE